MAYEILTEAGMRTAIAGVDLSGSQYRAARLDTADKLALPAAGGEIYGIVQNKPLLNEAATVAIAGISKGEVSAAVALGANLMVATDGRFLTATTGNKIVGIARGAASGAGVLVAVELVHLGTL